MYNVLITAFFYQTNTNQKYIFFAVFTQFYTRKCTQGVYCISYIYAQLAHFRNDRKKSAIQFGELVFQLKLDSICSA